MLHYSSFIVMEVENMIWGGIPDPLSREVGYVCFLLWADKKHKGVVLLACVAQVC